MSENDDHSAATYPTAPRRSPLVIWLTLAGIAGLALLYVAVAPAPFQPVRRHPAVGTPLPTVNLTPLTVDGPPLELRGLRGKVVLLNFWGTWCPPCVEEFPHLERVAAKYAKDSGFRLISVSCEAGPDEADLTELREQTRAFLKQMESATPTYADPSGDTRRAIEIVSGEGFAYPTTLVLDRDGVIRGFWIGYSPQAMKEIERTLRELLVQVQPQESAAVLARLESQGAMIFRDRKNDRIYVNLYGLVTSPSGVGRHEIGRSLSELRAVPNLTRLSLRSTPISDEEVPLLKHLKHLEGIDLGSTHHPFEAVILHACGVLERSGGGGIMRRGG